MIPIPELSASRASADGNPKKRDLKVWLICTGVGFVERGIETFSRECFDGLRGHPGLRIELFKGVGPDVLPDEHRLPCLLRNSALARLLGVLIRRNGYIIEQLTSFVSLAWRLRTEQPDVIFLSEGNLRRYLFLCRRWLGVPFRLLFSNGGPVSPPFLDMEHVQQVTPYLFEVGLQAGQPPERQSLVPYGIHVPAGPPAGTDPAAKRAAREQLRLPLERPIVISVGWITAGFKRMDYTVREIAAMPEPRPFLVLLGYQDAESIPVLALASESLGVDGFTARTVPYQQVQDYYLAADIFVLASLLEGFGRVYLEALIAGLPVVAHDHPAMRYVLAEEGRFADLRQPGAMATALASLLACQPDASAAVRRRESVRRRFSWDALAPAYLDMFHRCHGTPLPLAGKDEGI